MPRKKKSTTPSEQVGFRLSSHEKVCAERMSGCDHRFSEIKLLLVGIEKRFDKLDSRLEDVRRLHVKP